MKGFIFRLERVFRLREQLERQRAEALTRAIQEEQARRDAVERAEERLHNCATPTAIGDAGLTNAGTLRNAGLTVAAAAAQIESAQRSHDAAIDQVAKEEQQFGQARMERRVVERLRERRRVAWDVEQSRAEQQEQDGISANRHGRDQEAA